MSLNLLLQLFLSILVLDFFLVNYLSHFSQKLPKINVISEENVIFVGWKSGKNVLTRLSLLLVPSPLPFLVVAFKLKPFYFKIKNTNEDRLANMLWNECVLDLYIIVELSLTFLNIREFKLNITIIYFNVTNKSRKQFLSHLKVN